MGRKEIIIYALFSINALWHINNNYTNFKLILTAFLLLFFTFWHEFILFFLPYFLILHLLHYGILKNQLKFKIKLGLIYFIPILVSTLIIYIFGTEIN